ncbi:MAG: NAD(P)-binding domain-containing protein [Defluviitaleaceae bacterium]|nr:NAD(P)-binding domain-containing protein [Defluviitaleaceae bacterium]
MKGIILKDDRRYEYTEKYLETKGYIFDESIKPKNLDFIIFPFIQEVKQDLYDDTYFKELGKEVQIFSGVRSDYLTKKCEKHALKYNVMMEDAGVICENAVPTSEGVIAYIVNNMVTTISGSRILVIGYGNCGRDLAKRLKSLDANVHALVRGEEKEKLAYEDAIKPIYLKELFLHEYDAIVNTVPSTVLSDEMLKMTNGVLLIDIASKPYGFNMELAKSLNEKSNLLPGIPGKYAIKTAGEILGKYVHDILRGKTK